ncbi:neurogenic locus notch homolog protein 2-like isoform X2 [Pecten maximus]|uniref:neurogenic locus notch homolog protein 2-like isoform X2 n=1 Tax=Pecten maximus TaxID=6579 RepID=UPI0014580D12|nr:neurogenic locus notch homolog protein 2-like isoform X2 [Pecten maximus]
MATLHMASRFFLVVVLVSSSVHGMLDWSELFTHWLPFRPHACPSQDLDSNEKFTLVQTEGTHCRSSLQNKCHQYHHSGKTRSRFYMSTIYNGPCSSVNTTTCSNYECKQSCVDGYHRNSDGRCVNTVTLHCFNGGSLNYNLTKCVCPANFTGEQCDIPICNPGCRNGGVCSQPPDSKCYCPDHVTGSTCETPICGKGCLNGGECVLNGTTSRCVCRPGFVGQNCEWGSYYLPVCDASDEVDNTTRCMFDEECDDGRYCCSSSSTSIFGHCSMPENNITCIHPDGAVVAKNDIYNSVRDCQACVCKAPSNASAEHGDILCISSGCSSDFLSNPHCCPKTTDNRPCPPPVIRGCPDKREIIPVFASKYGNHALLVNTFEAHNCLGSRLHVDLNRVDFSACACGTEKIYTVTATSEKDFNNRQGTCDFRVVVEDITPPVFVTCPATMYVRQGEKVSWQKPEVTDNVGVEQINLYNSRIKNNSKDASPGIYFLEYIAIDWQGNDAKCRFRVHVLRNNKDDSHYPSELRQRKTHMSPVIIIGSVVGVLCITLIAIVVIMVRVCHIRKKRLRGVQQQQQQQRVSTTTDIYSIYTNDPPPYEIAAKHKLPKYSQSDNPPKYEEVTQEAYNNPSYTSSEEVAGTSEGISTGREDMGGKRVTIV